MKQINKAKSYQEIKREKVIIQTTEHTCRACAIATLLNYFGEKVEEFEVLNFLKDELSLEKGLNLL